MTRNCPTCRDPVPDGSDWCPKDGTPLGGAAGRPKRPDPLVGTLLAGRYVLKQRLSAGGFGIVYLAHQATIDRPVAVKVLSGDVASQAEVQQRFLNEAKAISRLNSPYTVRLIDFGSLDDGRLYMVTEFIEGESLDVVVQNDGLSLLEAVRTGDQICQSLHEAHAAGIVHRDLKPQNLMRQRVADEWIVKVLDFGIAKLGAAGTVTAAHSVLGTPQYMAPEQAQAEAVDARADLYALGVVLYELLAGRPPFEGGSVSSLIYRHIHEAPPPLSEVAAPRPIPAALEAAVMRLLEKRPEDRFQSAREVQTALAEWIRTAGPEAEAPRQPVPPPSGRPPAPSTLLSPPHTGRRRAVALAMVVLAAAVGVGLALALNRPTPVMPLEPQVLTVAAPPTPEPSIVPPTAAPASTAAPAATAAPEPTTAPPPAAARVGAARRPVSAPQSVPPAVPSHPETWQVKPGFE